jgi:hypothetical protein
MVIIAARKLRIFHNRVNASLNNWLKEFLTNKSSTMRKEIAHAEAEAPQEQ